MTPYIIAGLVTGGVYAISALGMVFIYRASKIFNFAQGAIGFFVAMVYYQLHAVQGWPIVPSAVLSILVIAPALGVFLWLVLFRHLTDASANVRLVAAIGLAVALPQATQLAFGADLIYDAPGLAPRPLGTFEVGGVNLNTDQLAVMAAAVFVAIVIPALLRFTGVGLELRASVDNRELASAAGINSPAVSAGSWAFGCALAGLAGVLLTPIAGLEPNHFTLLMIAGFAAAAVGGLWNLPLTFGGAIGIGLAEAISTKYAGTSGILSQGLRPSLPFFVLVAALLLQRRSSILSRVEPSATSARSGHIARRYPLVRGWVLPGVGVAAVAASAFVFSGDWLAALALGCGFAIVFLSFVPVTGDGGMITLAQASFVGIGAVTAAKLSAEHGVTPFVAVLCAGLFTGGVGLIVALPALRLSDIYLALATFSFGLFMDNLVFPMRSVSFDPSGLFGLTMPHLHLLGWNIDDNRSFVFAALGVFVILALLIRLMRRSTLGLNLTAVRWSQNAAATSGVPLVRTKLISFAFSAFLAGIGGAMIAGYNGRVDIGNYPVLVGLVWLAVMTIFGIASIAGALVAGIVFTFMPQLFAQYLPASWSQVPTILFGVGAIGLAKEPDGIVAQVSRNIAALRLKLRRRSTPPAVLVDRDAAVAGGTGSS
ncbi:MAG: ABC transporter permease [Actinobacteria bacterium]|nr:MAG: ABC transporter permease [Actinomycetota bacterium]